MKRFIATSLCVIQGLLIMAQKPVILTSETHAIRNESNNEMIFCKYASPGNGGENVLWDFTGLESLNDFTGYVKSAYQTANAQLFPEANSELQEFDGHFYFRITGDRMEQLGYTGGNNTIIVHYDKPFIKLEFPFTYGDKFSGEFSGTETVNSVSRPLHGGYTVTADGYGSLVLPGNHKAERVLRVKTEKSYSYDSDSKSAETSIVTYRWYAESNRYPLLVLTEIRTGTTISTQAAYNTVFGLAPEQIADQVTSPSFFTLFPNPAGNCFSIQFTLESEETVVIDIYDMSGKKAASISHPDMISGFHSIYVVPTAIGLTSGAYLLKVIAGGTTYSSELILK